MARLDLDEDGHVDFDEFAAGLLDWKEVCPAYPRIEFRVYCLGFRFRKIQGMCSLTAGLQGVTIVFGCFNTSFMQRECRLRLGGGLTLRVRKRIDYGCSGPPKERRYVS